jgi:hypothetical protein
VLGLSDGHIRCDGSCSCNYLLLVTEYFVCLLLGYDTVYCGVCVCVSVHACVYTGIPFCLQGQTEGNL